MTLSAPAPASSPASASAEAVEYGIVPTGPARADGTLELTLPGHFDAADPVDVALLLGFASDHLAAPWAMIDVRYTGAPGAEATAVVGLRGTLGHHLDTVTIGHTGPAPSRAHATDGGWDIAAAEDTVVPAGNRAVVSTGLFVDLPAGHRIDVRPRSGLAAKSGITVLNTPGLVDAGYTGEVKVILFNTTVTDFAVTSGMRIAQLVVERVVEARFVAAEFIAGSDRGAGGFGSTGA